MVFVVAVHCVAGTGAVSITRRDTQSYQPRDGDASVTQGHIVRKVRKRASEPSLDPADTPAHPRFRVYETFGNREDPHATTAL